MPLKRVLKNKELSIVLLRHRWILLGVGILLSLTASLVFPLHPDEKVFVQVAQVIVDGGQPYRDVVDNKPPGIYWLLTPFVAIFGQNLAFLRLIPFALNIIIGWLLYFICRTIYNDERGVVVAGLYLLISPHYQSNFILTEVPMTVCILMGTLLAIRYIQTWVRWLALWSGVWAFAAILFKQQAAAYWLVILVFIFIISYKKYSNLKQSIGVGSCYLLGSVVALIPPLFYLWKYQLVCIMWYESVVHNYTSYMPYPALETIQIIPQLILPLLLLWVLVRSKVKNAGFFKYRLLFTAMLIGSIPFLLFRPYHHYWIPVVAFVILISLSGQPVKRL